MIPARALTRATARAPLRASKNSLRFASTTEAAAANASSAANTTANAAKSNQQAIIGGLVGGSAVFLVGYGYYHFSGAKTLVNGLHSTKQQFTSMTQKITSETPKPNEAIQWLRSTASSYAAFIPGAKGYVDSAFDSLDKVAQEHGPEVEEIVNKAYGDIKNITQKEGASMQAAVQTWGVLENALKDLGSLSGDLISETIDAHPELKEKFGGKFSELKDMTSGLGEEGQKQLNDTVKKVKDVFTSGGGNKMEQVQKIVQEAYEKAQKMGDQAYQKGLEKAKPYLDKNPEVKKFVDENADILKKGNVGEVMQKISQALYRKDTKGLQEYVESAKSKAKEAGDKTSSGGGLMSGGLGSLASMIPSGSEILPKLQKLQEVAQNKGEDAEKILKGALKDVQDVLQKRVEEAEKLAGEAKGEAEKKTKK